ncbi:MAG: methionyl-tRNA formyltransferase, partial [Planctomycetota bacterium]
MRIVMFGTGPFAVPTFTRLMRATADQVVALVTRPIDDAGQRRKSAANPMRDAAQALSAASPAGSALPVLAPADANASVFVRAVRALQRAWRVGCDFGPSLSAACVATARWGGINL